MCILLKIVRYHNIFARLIFKCSPIEICTVWYIMNGVCVCASVCEHVNVDVFGWSSLWMKSARSMHKQWTKSVQCRSSRQLRTTLFMPWTCRHRRFTKLSHIQIVVIWARIFTNALHKAPHVFDVADDILFWLEVHDICLAPYVFVCNFHRFQNHFKIIYQIHLKNLSKVRRFHLTSVQHIFSVCFATNCSLVGVKCGQKVNNSS